MGSLSKRRIDVTITLGKGTFGADVGDTISLSGYRVKADMDQFIGNTSATADVQIFGLPLDTLNRCTNIGGVVGQVRDQNKILISAGADGEALTTFFLGNIYWSWAQMQDAPNACLVVHAQYGIDVALTPVGASSYVGDVQVANVMADFAKEAGWGFTNNGVNVVLRNPYFPGTTISKIRACAKAARIFYAMDHDTLAIWPDGSSRKQDSVPVISPQSGLVGYPVYSSQGVIIRCIARTDIKVGDKFTVSGSALTPANQTWVAHVVKHSIENQTPNGAWFTDITGSRMGADAQNGR